MRPRFSILTLMGVTAYVATIVAALAAPLLIWNEVSCSLWLVGVFVLAVTCVVGHPHRSVFCRGMHNLFVTYCIISLVLDRPTYFEIPAPRMRPPHDWILGAIDTYSPSLPYPEHIADVSAALEELRANGELPTKARERVARQRLISERRDRLLGELRLLLFTQCSFAFAIAGGIRALWRHRLLERREKAVASHAG